MRNRITATIAAVLLAAVAIAVVVTLSSGASVRNGGPLVAGTVQGIWTLNAQARPALAWSVPLENKGKRTLVLDRIGVLGATPGLHLVGACLAWYGTHSRRDSPATLLDENCDLRPKAAGTAVPPGRGFVPELRLQFAGRPEGWAYRILDVAYHVGRHRYERKFDVGYRYLFCRTRACVKAFEGKEMKGQVGPP
jgi:hypothetical protein